MATPCGLAMRHQSSIRPCKRGLNSWQPEVGPVDCIWRLNPVSVHARSTICRLAQESPTEVHVFGSLEPCHLVQSRSPSDSIHVNLLPFTLPLPPTEDPRAATATTWSGWPHPRCAHVHVLCLHLLLVQLVLLHGQYCDQSFVFSASRRQFNSSAITWATLAEKTTGVNEQDPDILIAIS